MTTLNPLGIKNPLLVPQPLGQQLLQCQFLFPLGARPMAGFKSWDFFPDYSSLGVSSADQLPSQSFSKEASTTYAELTTDASSIVQPKLELDGTATTGLPRPNTEYNNVSEGNPSSGSTVFQAYKEQLSDQPPMETSVPQNQDTDAAIASESIPGNTTVPKSTTEDRSAYSLFQSISPEQEEKPSAIVSEESIPLQTPSGVIQKKEVVLTPEEDRGEDTESPIHRTTTDRQRSSSTSEARILSQDATSSEINLSTPEIASAPLEVQHNAQRIPQEQTQEAEQSPHPGPQNPPTTDNPTQISPSAPTSDLNVVQAKSASTEISSPLTPFEPTVGQIQPQLSDVSENQYLPEVERLPTPTQPPSPELKKNLSSPSTNLFSEQDEKPSTIAPEEPSLPQTHSGVIQKKEVASAPSKDIEEVTKSPTQRASTDLQRSSSTSEARVPSQDAASSEINLSTPEIASVPVEVQDNAQKTPQEQTQGTEQSLIPSHPNQLTTDNPTQISPPAPISDLNVVQGKSVPTEISSPLTPVEPAAEKIQPQLSDVSENQSFSEVNQIPTTTQPDSLELQKNNLPSPSSKLSSEQGEKSSALAHEASRLSQSHSDVIQKKEVASAPSEDREEITESSIQRATIDLQTSNPNIAQGKSVPTEISSPLTPVEPATGQIQPQLSDVSKNQSLPEFPQLPTTTQPASPEPKKNLPSPSTNLSSEQDSKLSAPAFEASSLPQSHSDVIQKKEVASVPSEDREEVTEPPPQSATTDLQKSSSASGARIPPQDAVEQITKSTPKIALPAPTSNLNVAQGKSPTTEISSPIAPIEPAVEQIQPQFSYASENQSFPEVPQLLTTKQPASPELQNNLPSPAINLSPEQGEKPLAIASEEPSLPQSHSDVIQKKEVASASSEDREKVTESPPQSATTDLQRSSSASIGRIPSQDAASSEITKSTPEIAPAPLEVQDNSQKTPQEQTQGAEQSPNPRPQNPNTTDNPTQLSPPAPTSDLNVVQAKSASTEISSPLTAFEPTVGQIQPQLSDVSENQSSPEITQLPTPNQLASPEKQELSHSSKVGFHDRSLQLPTENRLSKEQPFKKTSVTKKDTPIQKSNHLTKTPLSKDEKQQESVINSPTKLTFPSSVSPDNKLQEEELISAKSRQVEKTDSEIIVAQLLSGKRKGTVLENLVQLSPLNGSSSLAPTSLSVVEQFLLPIHNNLHSKMLSSKETNEEIVRQRDYREVGGGEITSMNTTQYENSSLPTQNLSGKSLTIPSTKMPTSWSQISELIGEIPPKNINPAVIQRHAVPSKSNKRSGDLVFTPQGFRQDIVENNSIDQHSLTKIQLDPSTSIDSETVKSREIALSASDSELEDQSLALEILAQEIYNLLRQRIKLERERQGNNYSGRLPWG